MGLPPTPGSSAGSQHAFDGGGPFASATAPPEGKAAHAPSAIATIASIATLFLMRLFMKTSLAVEACKKLTMS
jgi:hypothetical protein